MKKKLQPLPSFNSEGLLPVGDYELSLDELKTSWLVTGENLQSTTWDSEWRRKLVDNLEVMTLQLWQVGVTEIYIDGSFVEDKDRPNDIDGYFVIDVEKFEESVAKLNQLDKWSVWTWSLKSRTQYKNYPKLQLPMWHKYRVELFPEFGQLSGIKDEFGNNQIFPAAFRRARRNGTPKGIIKIQSPIIGGSK